MNISDLKTNLSGMGHGSTLNKVRGIEHLLERAANNMLAKIDPIDTVRTTALSSLIYDDVYNYPLPSDYKKGIDLLPQDERESLDKATRQPLERFDLRKLIDSKTIAIESSEGTKFLRANWRSRSPITFHSMNSLTENGTWSVVGSATGLKAQTLYKVSGSASIEFDLVATGDGIQNTTATAIDLTDEDEVADVFFWIYLPSATSITSVTAIWGNNLTSAYWTGVAQTAQADGTAFKTGWNQIKFSWSAATETGTVAPATIDSFKITVAATAAVTNLRIDNILFIVGKNFDLKYYSKYLLKNSAGTWITRTTSDSDTVVLDNDAINIYLYESLIEIAQQVEGEDSASDIAYALRKLNGNPDSPDPIERMGLYAKYRAEFPSESKKSVGSYYSMPKFK